MRIRIEGTEDEITYLTGRIRTILPIRRISPFIRLGRPHTWRVFLDTAPTRQERQAR
ncbi:hypothetical protein [Spongiactinospora sp. TRM90649]|uniref:hypothetical protein n=1 Tax=Spongiactinospora sp. TRM90649 TaxID=3031114 RepID=UPI0023F64F2F|nr:hypothetical protein [Spongiactinospora sp. TRM90649]MDF5757630.1 hypothetical protein [Spongiactinospora sp. TRM90649]